MNVSVVCIDVSLIGDRFWAKSYENNPSGFESFHHWIRGRELTISRITLYAGARGHSTQPHLKAVLRRLSEA